MRVILFHAVDTCTKCGKRRYKLGPSAKPFGRRFHINGCHKNKK